MDPILSHFIDKETESQSHVEKVAELVLVLYPCPVVTHQKH
jgi:hypothetical protein